MKSSRIIHAIALVCGCLMLHQPLKAGEYAPIQSPARPFGLDIWDQVQLTGSDARAAEFNANYLPFFLQLINSQLAESAVFTDREGFKLDASRLFLRSASDRPIRVYFIFEGAGYQNSLGLSKTLAGSPTMGEGKLLFPNSSFRGVNSTAARTVSEPLRSGDFVELDHGAPGLQLDFFLVADGARGGRNVWYNDISRNWDGKQHVVAFLLPNSPYVMIGFEDLPHGGDLDYNDCLFVIDIGEQNAENLFSDFSDLPK